MQEIEIVYKRWWRQQRIQTTFPSAWSEMNTPQFTALYKKRDDVSLLSLMLDVPKRVVKRLSLLQIYELAQLFDFIRKDTKVSTFLLDKIYCPKVGILYAPKPRLAEMTFIQFIYADSFYMQYVDTLKPEILCDLTAHLYVGESGYDRKVSERNAERLKRLDQGTLEAIALNYGLVRKWIGERYPQVFPAGNTQKQGNTGGWPDVFDNLVGDDLKDRDKYAEIPINSVFKFMTKKIKEAKKNGSRL